MKNMKNKKIMKIIMLYLNKKETKIIVDYLGIKVQLYVQVAQQKMMNI